MSREIKFRAWDPNDKKWMFDGDGFALAGEMVLMGEWGAVAWHRVADDSLLPLIPVQYTGLKDKNGVEIYEGDIVRRGEDLSAYKLPAEAKNIYSVVYDQGCFACKEMASVPLTQGFGIKFVVSAYLAELEVIGNIYENPELLETAS